MKRSYSVSFVIPVYKSEKSLSHVVKSIAQIKGLDWEVVLVNDDSPDNVHGEILKLIKKFKKRVIYIQLRKNGGQHAAIMEGFKYASKPFVATIDDDGQNPPAQILEMLKELISHDYDLMYGVPKENKHTFVRKILSKLNLYISKYTINNVNLIPVSNVRVMKTSLAKSVSQATGSYNYADGLFFSLTNHIGYMYVQNLNRKFGSSTYSFSSLLKLWVNHTFGYSNFVIKAISFLSLCASVSAFIIGLSYLFLTFNNSQRPTGWLSLFLTVSFLMSMNFLIIGILAEYIGRIYVNINQKSIKLTKIS